MLNRTEINIETCQSQRRNRKNISNLVLWDTLVLSLTFIFFEITEE